MYKPLGNLTEVSKNLVKELMKTFELSVVEDSQMKAAQKAVFDTLFALRSHSYDDQGRTVEVRFTWSDDDVLEVNPNLNADQVAGVLDMLKKCHDATVGVTWETIEITIDTYLRQEA